MFWMVLGIAVQCLIVPLGLYGSWHKCVNDGSDPFFKRVRLEGWIVAVLLVLLTFTSVTLGLVGASASEKNMTDRLAALDAISEKHRDQLESARRQLQAFWILSVDHAIDEVDDRVWEADLDNAMSPLISGIRQLDVGLQLLSDVAHTEEFSPSKIGIYQAEVKKVADHVVTVMSTRDRPEDDEERKQNPEKDRLLMEEEELLKQIGEIAKNLEKPTDAIHLRHTILKLRQRMIGIDQVWTDLLRWRKRRNQELYLDRLRQQMKAAQPVIDRIVKHNHALAPQPQPANEAKPPKD